MARSNSNKSLFTFTILALSLLCLFASVAEGVREYPKHGLSHREVARAQHYATLVGTQWLDHAKKSFDVGMTFLPDWHSTLTAYGTNHTDMIQFTGLSDNNQEGSQMIVYADDQKAKGCTSVLFVDVHTTGLVVPPVKVPVISIAFVGISIKLNYDATGKRTIVSGALPITQKGQKLQHGFYEIIDGSSEATSMGFKLEDAVPKGFFMNGQLEILGTKLSAFDASTGVMWQGLARNNTKSPNDVEFLVAGIDVHTKKMTKSHVFPMGDCRFLGSMVWDEYTKSMFMITFNLQETGFILAKMDPTAGTCVKVHDIKSPPLYGLIDFDPADAKHETLTFLQDATKALTEEETRELSRVEVLTEFGPTPIVTSPLLTGSGSRAVHDQIKMSLTPAGDNQKKMMEISTSGGPQPKAQPSSVVNYDVKTGQHTEMSPVTCDPVTKHDCPWQLGWFK